MSNSSHPGPNASADEHLLDGVHILVADDSPDELEMFQFVFELHGARVTTAESASLAHEAIRTDCPDVLVSDITLADGDGYDLVRRLRAAEPSNGPSTPAVAVTGWGRECDREAAYAAGFQAYLPKPVAVATLVDVVASLAATRRRPSMHGPRHHG